MEPGREAASSTEPVERAEGGQERLLHGVLGVFLGVEKVAGDGQEAAAVSADERRESFAVTCPEASEEPGFRKWRRRGRDGRLWPRFVWFKARCV
jgi:hypothetical protein